MPRLDVSHSSREGLNATYLPNSGDPSTTEDYWFWNDGRVLLHIKNPGSSALTDVKVTTQITVGGVAVDDATIAVGATSEVLAGPFSPAIFNNYEGETHIRFADTVTGVRVAAVRLGDL